MEYTLNQLVGEWKMRKGLEPLRIDATLRRQDAFEIEEYAAREINIRYAELLATAPIELLDAEDITDNVIIENYNRGVALLKLPDDCIRPVEWLMEQWERPAVIAEDPESPLALKQSSTFTRGRSCHPVAVADRSGRYRLYSFKGPTPPRAERILGIIQPPKGIIRCHPRALELIFK